MELIEKVLLLVFWWASVPDLSNEVLNYFLRLSHKLPTVKNPRRKSECGVKNVSGAARDDKRPKLDEPDNMVGPGRKDSKVDKHYVLEDGSKVGYNVTKPLMKLRDTLVAAQRTLSDVDDLL